MTYDSFSIRLTTFQDSSGDGRYDGGIPTPDAPSDEEVILAEAGDLFRIMDVVSSYWDSNDKDSASRSSSSLSQNEGRVGYLDPNRRMARAPSSSSMSQRGSQSKLYAERGDFKIDVVPPKVVLPKDIRMITHFDNESFPSLPVDPPCTLPNISQSPLSLLKASSGGALDMNWLESFDDSALEALVPRDPFSGRLLTLGSIDHEEGNCKPCIFFLKAKCFKGLRCSFCHFNHSLRKNVPSFVAKSPVEENNIDSASSLASFKSKRVRPSKRTREMIKQINEQTIFQDLPDDPQGPAMSVDQSSRSRE